MKLSKFTFPIAIAIALILSTFTLLSIKLEPAPDEAISRGNPHEFLSQFQGRQFPNEIPPRDDLVAAQAAGIPLGASRAEAEALLNKWYQNFYAKNEKSGPNPIAFAERMKALAAAEAQGKSIKAANKAVTGTAQMLMIPIQFEGTDVLSACDQVGGTQTGVVTVTGPLKGTIPDPATEGDNNTTYAPGGDFTIQWYQDLMFDNGVGVIRTDLNGGAGVDLTGVSASNWYEEQSENQYMLQGDIYTSWIPLTHSVAWYGWGNEQEPGGLGVSCNGTNSGGGQFVIDAVNKLNQQDPNFDWAKYDVDGNGVVDHLMIIHAGVDNSAGGGTYGNFQLWAHSSDVYCDKNDGNGPTLGCVVDDGGTPGNPSDDIMIANYTHIPEDADIGVVVHEYGHDIGLPDYYDTSGATSNSSAHWIVMSSGSWSGALGGSHPAPFNPWARYFFGWEEPLRVNYDDPALTVKIGQSEPTPNGTEDSVWIDLPDQEKEVENLAGDGKGLHAILGNSVVYTLTRAFDLSGATAPTFTFDTHFDIEEDWDYTYIRASTDGGQNWTILLNAEGEYGTSDPNGSTAWWGQGGLTGVYDGKLTYDLSAYAGQSSVLLQFAYVTDVGFQGPGIWIDNFSLAEIGYTNNLEDSSDWSNNNWEVVPFTQISPHYYMLEWRNDEGSIAQKGQTELYYSLATTQTGWVVDKFSASVPGLLVWYRNEFYPNNQAVAGGREFESPATGPKGELLLVDSHYEPIPWSGGWWDAGQFSNRRSAMDGAFTLNDTPAWMIHDNATLTDTVMDFGSRPAVSVFRDSLRSVPGWVYVSPSVYRADRAASVVIPGSKDYSTRIRQLDTNGNPGADLTGFWGFTVGGQVLGSGNPGDSNAQYGVNVELTDQASDGTWGEVSLFNQKIEVSSTVTPTSIMMAHSGAYTVTYQTTVSNSGTSVVNGVAVTYTLDSDLNLVSMTTAGTPVGTVDLPTSSWTGDMAPGNMTTITVVASGTTDVGGTFGTGSFPIQNSTTVDAFDGQTSLAPVSLETSVAVPSISFVAPTNNQMIGAFTTTTVSIEVSISSFFNVGSDAGDDGHWHLSVDGGAETPIFTYTTAISLTTNTTHTLRARLVNPSHVWLGPEDEITVTLGIYKLFLPVVFKS